MASELKLGSHSHLAEFVSLIDKWFDLMNTNSIQAKLKRKPALMPFSNKNDERLSWLFNEFQGNLLFSKTINIMHA